MRNAHTRRHHNRNYHVFCFILDNGEAGEAVTFIAGLWIRIHFFWIRIRIRIQSLMLETHTDPDPPIRIQGFNDQKLKKNYSWKFFLIFFYQKLQYTYP